MPNQEGGQRLLLTIPVARAEITIGNIINTVNRNLTNNTSNRIITHKCMIKR